MASKLNAQILEKAIKDILAFSSGETVTKGGEDLKGKKRNFVETVEAQISLKNYDPQRDKRFNGTFKLPATPRPNLKFCMLGNAAHCEQADRIGIDHMSVEDLKKVSFLCWDLGSFEEEHDGREKRGRREGKEFSNTLNKTQHNAI